MCDLETSRMRRKKKFVCICVCVYVCMYVGTVPCQRTELRSEVSVVSMAVHTSFVIRKNARGNKIKC